MSQCPHPGELQIPRGVGERGRSSGETSGLTRSWIAVPACPPLILSQLGRDLMPASPSHTASPREMDLNTTFPRDPFRKENNGLFFKLSSIRRELFSLDLSAGKFNWCCISWKCPQGFILRIKLLEMMWGSCFQGCKQGGKHRGSRGDFQRIPEGKQ